MNTPPGSDRFGSSPSLNGPESSRHAPPGENGKHAGRKEARQPVVFPEGNGPAGKIITFLDWLLGAIAVFSVLFGPWAFGTTQPWSVSIMTGVGWTAWAILLLKLLVGQVAARGYMTWPGRTDSERCDRFGWVLAASTALILLYCLVSAVNARAAYHPETWSFEYRDALLWLPHSYDSASSWQVFWVYSGIAGIFWGTRSWIISGKPMLPERGTAGRSRHRATPLLPPRLRLLLWVLSINGALLGLEAIIQRTTGTNRLLWMVVPHINSEGYMQFGPYAYRSNAAQYFNLIWPVSLGFWWTYQKARRNQGLQLTTDHNSHHFLLSFVLIMAICPLVSISRGGAIITGVSVVLAGVVLLLAQWHSVWQAKLSVFGLVATILGLGLLLGWEQLGPRLEMLQQGVDSREALFISGRQMAAAQPVFGTGPGTFGNLFQLFRRINSDYWPAQQHNDWLEMLITFGWVGSSIIVLSLMLVLLRWFWRGGVFGEKHFVMLCWIALGGCLIHAYFDFPFQVHSILTLFIILCAILSCLSREGYP